MIFANPTAMLILVVAVLVVALIWWRFASGGRSSNSPAGPSINRPSGAEDAPAATGSVTRTSHRLRIEERGQQRRIVLDGSQVSALEDIADPQLRQLAQDALQQAEQLPLSQPLQKHSRSIVVNGVTYHDPAEIQDPKLRQVVEDALKRAHADH